MKIKNYIIEHTVTSDGLPLLFFITKVSAKYLVEKTIRPC